MKPFAHMYQSTITPKNALPNFFRNQSPSSAGSKRIKQSTASHEGKKPGLKNQITSTPSLKHYQSNIASKLNTKTMIQKANPTPTANINISLPESSALKGTQILQSASSTQPSTVKKRSPNRPAHISRNHKQIYREDTGAKKGNLEQQILKLATDSKKPGIM